MTTAPLAPSHALSGFAKDVRAGLRATPKTLPSKYFYDALGSRLFEAICELPWYPITRAELLLLELFAGSMVEPFGDLTDLIELGCGGGVKVRLLARALAGRAAPLTVHLVDISEKALELSRSALAPLPDVEVVTHAGTYEAGLRAATEGARGRRLVLFLGSNIGNFDPPASRRLLADLRAALEPGDGLLLGADLVRSEAELVRAYDDPLGVTAAFNKNVLHRIDAELGADFDLDGFAHRAVWNAAASRVEMHLVSRRSQTVRIEAARLDVGFAEDETIWTESSYKYTAEEVVEMGRGADLHRHGQWIEEAARFSTTLFIAGNPGADPRPI